VEDAAEGRLRIRRGPCKAATGGRGTLDDDDVVDS